MHNTVNIIDKSVKTLEKRNLTEEQKQKLDAFKVVFNFFQNKQAQGLALTSEEEAVLNALLVIVIFMVKDSSVTLNSTESNVEEGQSKQPLPLNKETEKL